jgi:CBS domain-containing protein
MPFIVQDLIDENPNVIVARLKEPVQQALSRMIENDFSQLPIVDDEHRPVGMITSESILRALSNFGVGLDKLRVEHARVRADSFRSDADLFELLDRLQDTFAVLIVDGEGRLAGIVTNYDTAEYFRRRAEDMMLVEDIETMVKDYIQSLYQVEADQSNEEKLEEAVQRMTDSGQALRSKFERALIHYLTLQAGDGKGAVPQAEWLEMVFNKHFDDERPSRQFEDLSLSEYITLLLDKEQWSHYQSIFNLDREALYTLLHKVRETRNALAHFRGEITPAQRDHLRFSANWLAQYQDAVITAFEPRDMGETPDLTDDDKPETVISPQTDDAEQILPIEDEAEPEESRYAPLAIWLQNQPPQKDLVKPSFAQIEEIIGGELPRSAYEHRAWWANDTVGHVQSQQWLDVGWRVASVNFTTQVIRFARIKERQKAYIDFFSQLNAELTQKPGFEHLQSLPDGTNWSWVKNVAIDDENLAALNFSFGRGGIFRIELYIDSGDKAINKRLFDLLHERKAAIEEKLGYELHWQRLNNRRASRVARILSGSITDDEETLTQLRAEAIPTMIAFTNVLYPIVLELGQRVLAEKG